MLLTMKFIRSVEKVNQDFFLDFVHTVSYSVKDLHESYWTYREFGESIC